MTVDETTFRSSAEVDKASFNNAEKAYDELADSAKSVEKSTDKNVKSFDKLNKGLAKLRREKVLKKVAEDAADLAKETGKVDNAMASLVNEMIKLGDVSEAELKKTVGQFERLLDAQEKATKNARELNAAQATEQFDITSREVSALGDVGSQQRTIGGAIGRVPGLQGVGGAIELAAELPDVAEALPKLAESAKAAPKALNATAESLSKLGPKGAAVAVAVAIAVAAMTLLTKSIKKAAEEQKKIVAAREEVNTLIIDGDREAALTRRQDAERNIAIAQKNADDARAAQARLDEGLQFSDFLDPFMETAEDVEAQAAKSAEETIASEQKVIDAIDESFGTFEEASSDLADTTDSDAQAIMDAANASSDAQADMAQSIDDAAEAAREAAEKIAAAKDKYSKALEDIGTQELRALADTQRKARRAATKAQEKFNDDFAKIDAKTLDDEAKARAKAAQKDIEAQEKLQITLAKIREKGDRASETALENRDFIAFAKAKQTTDRESKAALEQAEVERAERQATLEQSLSDQRAATEEQRQTLLNSFEDAKRDRVQALKDQQSDIKRNADRRREDAKTALDRELAQAKQAYAEKLNLEGQYLNSSVQQMQSILGRAGGNIGRASSPISNITSSSSTVNNTLNQQFGNNQSPQAIAQNVLSVLQGLS